MTKRICHNRLQSLLLICALTLLLQGCSYYDAFEEHPSYFGNALQNHRSPLVKVPANAGYDVGLTVGVPLLVPTYLTAIALSPFSSNSDELLGLLAIPTLGMGSLVGTTCGAPCWVLFGWWWPEGEPQEKFIEQDGVFISRCRLKTGSADGWQQFEYGLKRDGLRYVGWLTIRSKAGGLLWNHQWIMTEGCLDELLLAECDKQKERKAAGKPYVVGAPYDGVSVDKWVKNIFPDNTFTDRLHYGVKVGWVMLRPGDLNADYLNFYAKRFNVRPDRLRDEILAQPSNLRIHYRSSSTEDYNQFTYNELVFVPSLNQYIMYGNRPY